MATSVGKVWGPEPAIKVWGAVTALDYTYGWLCFTEWHYFKDQAEQQFHRGMQHYLFA